MIRITRDSGYADKCRAYKVVLDGSVVGEIRDGQQFEMDVSQKRHQLYLKIDWCRSNIIDFEADGNTIEFQCGSNLREFKILLAILYTTVFRNQYIWLKKS